MNSHRYSGEEYEAQNHRNEDEEDDAERIEREMERREVGLYRLPTNSIN
jgi:hypothetical protein